MDPDHEIRADPRPTGVSARPSRNQWSGGDVALGDREEAGQPGLGGEQVVVAGVQRAVPDPEPDREQLAGRVEQEAEVRLAEQLPGPVRDRVEAAERGSRRRPALARSPAGGSASSAIVGGRWPAAVGSSSARSRAWLSTASRTASAQVTSSLSESLPALRGQGRGDVGQRARVRRERLELGRPGAGRRGRSASPGACRLRRAPRRDAAGSRVWRPPLVADRRRRPRAVSAIASPIPASAAATGSG